MKQVTDNFSQDFINTATETGIDLTPSLLRYELYRITKEKHIERPPVFITMSGGKIATAKNITVISGASKAGKTAVTGVIIAGAISKTGEIDGFPDLVVRPNPEAKAVIHFDTEQSPEDQQDLVNTVLARNGFDETPDYYYSYNTLQFELEDYQQYTDEICNLARERHNGIHMIIIDGGADYMKSINDDKEAPAVIRFFRKLSVKYNCPVITIIHTNPGSDKERGHAGSEFQRRCYSLLFVDKKDEISTLKPKLLRKAGNDIPLINFIYSKEKQYHIALEGSSENDSKDQKEMDRLKGIAEKCFPPPTSYRHTDAIHEIMQTTGKKIRTANDLLKNMEGFGFVIKGDDNHYRLKV